VHWLTPVIPATQEVRDGENCSSRTA
jgi:hypothetical protein